MKFPNLMRALTGEILAIEPEKLRAILGFLEFRAAGGRYTPSEIQAKIADRRKPLEAAKGAVCIIPIYGTISRTCASLENASGGCDLEELDERFSEAVNNPTISSIVLDIDSPGGSVTGVPEFANKVFAARKKKTIIAVCSGTMASGAYWIGSAADSIVCTPSGQVGSIGVYRVHCNEAGSEDNQGIVYTILSAGKYKTEGNNLEPLSDEAKAFIQSQIDEYYSMFINAVAEYRGYDAADVRSRYGEGRCLLASQAKAAGMIDRIATLADVLEELVPVGPSPRNASARAELDRIKGLSSVVPPRTRGSGPGKTE